MLGGILTTTSTTGKRTRTSNHWEQVKHPAPFYILYISCKQLDYKNRLWRKYEFPHKLVNV